MHVKTDKPPSPWMKRTNGNGQVHLPGPGHPAPEDTNNSSNPAAEVLQGPDIRPHAPDIRLLPKARKSGPFAAHPTTPIQRLQKFAPPAQTSGPQPGHPAPPEAPDIRPDARTSGSACLRTVKGRSPCTPSPPRLYILHPLPLSRVSIGLAHM